MIRDILLGQKRELDAQKGQLYIKRESEIKSLQKNIIKVVTGPRRAGKSFFIMNSMKDNFGYANFDDEYLTQEINYDEIVAAIDNIYSNPKLFFFDEIQNLPRWELFVNRLQRQGRNIILTGSNSNLLSSELATHLTGRHLETVIYPLSFREIVGDATDQTAAEIKGKFEKYLRDGGYPEPFVKNIDIGGYLKTLFESTLYKDAIKRYKIRKPRELEAVADFLISNTATQVSYNQIARSLGVKSVETIKKYCRILEESMLFFSIKKFSYKIKEQEIEARKIYCIDNGLIKAKAFSLTQNIGKLYENITAIELKRREYSAGTKIFYWKNPQTNEEVDFVVKKENRITDIIQVCCSLQNKKTEEREIRALLNASKELKCTNLILLNSSEEKSERKEWFGTKGNITYRPLWKWLLGIG
ncbi:ATP-binding protein [Candidatus Woesearchaeota archaeon]|nr:ATP-binding protein [Candidatus Woesearchaeota archaeon]